MEEKKKDISAMTEQEILRRQLELLAEVSQGYSEESLSELTKAMLGIYDRMTVQENYIPYKESKEPVEIKMQKDNWQEMREMGVEIKNESVVCDVVNLLLKSELSYLEANEALREADRALRHKAFATT